MNAKDDPRELPSSRSEHLLEANDRLAAEVEERRAAEAALRRHVERARRQQDAILRLVATDESTWGGRLRTSLRVDAETLGVARVSYWRIADGGSAIRCEALVRAGEAAVESGTELLAADFPAYFEALRTGSIIVADDAILDPRTSEFTDPYLRPAGIGAMLDVPVYLGGALHGVVCHEHVGGSRTWTLDEQQFALAIGQTLSAALEAEDRRRAEEALRASEQRFRAIANVSPVPLLVTTVADGRCLFANEAVGALSGIPAAELMGRRSPDFYADPEDRARIMQELREQGFVDGREILFARADGSKYWGRLSVRPLELDGHQAVITGIVDMTEHRRLEDALRHAALHDGLTGLPNRVAFLEELGREIGRAQRDETYRFALLFLDLDGFKGVNDALGHDAGDRVLVHVAERLRKTLRPMDSAARFGGDEFAILVADVDGLEGAEAVALRVQHALEQPPLISGPPGTPVVRASVGVALGDGRSDAARLLRDADARMYSKKQARGPER